MRKKSNTKGFTALDVVLIIIAIFICVVSIYAVVNTANTSLEQMRRRRIALSNASRAILLFNSEIGGIKDPSKDIIKISNRILKFVNQNDKIIEFKCENNQFLINNKKIIKNIEPDCEFVGFNKSGGPTLSRKSIYALEMNISVEAGDFGHFSTKGFMWLRNKNYYKGFARED